jgi:hypothetical protein
MKNKNLTLVVTVITTSFSALPVYADAISPQIKDKGHVYSKEKPDVEMYGTGIGGRAMEAMALRFEVERMLQDGEFEKAIPRAKKAVQLDPGDPMAHLLLARAMTRKLYTIEGPVDEKLLTECLMEWNLIWHHSADQFEQVEAKNEARRLMRVARVIAKKKKMEFEARLAAREALRKQREMEEREEAKAAAKTDKHLASSKSHPRMEEVPDEVAEMEDDDAEMDVTASLEADYGTPKKAATPALAAPAKAPGPVSATTQQAAPMAQPVSGKPSIAAKKKKFGLF